MTIVPVPPPDYVTPIIGAVCFVAGVVLGVVVRRRMSPRPFAKAAVPLLPPAPPQPGGEK